MITSQKVNKVISYLSLKMAFINKMLSFFDVNLFNIIHKYKTMTNMILNLIMMC